MISPEFQGNIYKHSVLPIGLIGTYIAFVVIIIVVNILIVGAYPWIEKIKFIPINFTAYLLIPVLYSYLSSPFETNRVRLASFLGVGGSRVMLLFSGHFVRLICYDDGLEVRMMFHCFFIPYDKIQKPEMRINIYLQGIPIESNIPGVPHYIRFWNCRVGKIYDIIIMKQNILSD